jgi:fructokinase
MEVHNLRSADQAITPEDASPEALDGARMLYFSGTMLLGETGFRTTLGLLEAARARGLFVAFDPNVRPSRTGHPERVRARLDAVLPFVDLVQTSRRDWADLWGDRTPEAMLDEGLALLVRTDGVAGAVLRTPRQAVEVPAEPGAAVDATGAGDAFMAALLARATAWLPAPVATVPAEVLRAWGRFAAAWAARIVRHRGAVTAYRHRRAPASGRLDF